MIATKEELAVYAGQRKHNSQLSHFEKLALFTRLKEVPFWGMSSHALDRLVEKGIKATREDVISTLNHANIVEYRIFQYEQSVDLYDERVILRSKAKVNGRYNLNVVYSLTNHRIISVWTNHVLDKHSTLDWSIYNKDMKVFGVN